MKSGEDTNPLKKRRCLSPLIRILTGFHCNLISRIITTALPRLPHPLQCGRILTMTRSSNSCCSSGCVECQQYDTVGLSHAINPTSIWAVNRRRNCAHHFELYPRKVYCTLGETSTNTEDFDVVTCKILFRIFKDQSIIGEGVSLLNQFSLRLPFIFVLFTLKIALFIWSSLRCHYRDRVPRCVVYLITEKVASFFSVISIDLLRCESRPIWDTLVLLYARYYFVLHVHPMFQKLLS